MNLKKMRIVFSRFLMELQILSSERKESLKLGYLCTSLSGSIEVFMVFLFGRITYLVVLSRRSGQFMQKAFNDEHQSMVHDSDRDHYRAKTWETFFAAKWWISQLTVHLIPQRVCPSEIKTRM